MAIELAPPEPDLREPRRHRARLYSACGWAVGAWRRPSRWAASGAHKPDRSRQRTPAAYRSRSASLSAVARMPPRVPSWNPKRSSGRTGARAAADRDRLAGAHRDARAHIDDMTGSIKQQAAPRPRSRRNSCRRAALPAPRRRHELAGHDRGTAATRGRLPSSRPRIAPTAKPDTPATEGPAAAGPRRGASANEPEPPPRQDEFGIDLGGGATIEALRAALDGGEGQFRPAAERPASAVPRANAARAAPAIGWWSGRCRTAAAARGLCAHFSCRPHAPAAPSSSTASRSAQH